MRKQFASLLKNKLKVNKKIHFLTADLGFGLFDDFEEEYQDNFHNVGAAEQLLIGAGVGLTLGGKIAICYSISPFLIYRPFEFIRNYVNYEKIPVKLVGAGRDKDYLHDGISHWAEDDEKILSCFPNIKIYKPLTSKDLDECFEDFLYNDSPAYLNLIR